MAKESPLTNLSAFQWDGKGELTNEATNAADTAAGATITNDEFVFAPTGSNYTLHLIFTVF
jgi:hypothetical protein